MHRAEYVPGRKLQQRYFGRVHVLPDQLFKPRNGKVNEDNTIYMYNI